jgi:hypothetical protein
MLRSIFSSFHHGIHAKFQETHHGVSFPFAIDLQHVNSPPFAHEAEIGNARTTGANNSFTLRSTATRYSNIYYCI